MSSEFVVKTRYHSDFRGPGRYVLSHIRRQWWIAVLMAIGAFSNAALAAVVPYLTGVVFNEISTPGPDPLEIVTGAVVLVLVSQSVRAVLQFMRNISSEVFAQRIERDVRDELYASLLGKSMTFHDSQPVGEIMARVTNDVRELNLMMNPGVNLVIGSGMFLLIPFFSVPAIHPQLLLVPLIFVVLHVIVQVRLVKTVHPIAEKVRSSFGHMNSRLAEALEGLQVVKGTAQEEAEQKRFNKLADIVRDYAIAQGEAEARYLSNLLFPLALAFGFLHAVLLQRAELINTGDIVNYMGQLLLFGFPVFTSLFSLSRIASGYASAARILKIICHETDLDQNVSGYRGTIQGGITFENVSFGYRPDAPVLHDLSFSIQPGRTIAIVGQTGTGKSTITKLLNRTYDANSGRVLVDGVDVRDWNLEALRSQISVIEQDVFLFSRTIAGNIGFGQDDAPLEKIVDAAKNAQAHDFIQQMPHGYDSVVGQRGVTLSGGQRQRIAIARAFQNDPPILVLDDSTSAIDSATEDRIQTAIWNAAKNRTTILITHRLSQIRWADHIIVLRRGHIVAQGAHEDLLQQSDDYRRIFARYESSSTDTSIPARNRSASSRA